MSRKEKRLPINSVGKVIKEAREKRGLSIEELAWKINDSKIKHFLCPPLCYFYIKCRFAISV